MHYLLWTSSLRLLNAIFLLSVMETAGVLCVWVTPRDK